jgi:hypothetical protein
MAATEKNFQAPSKVLKSLLYISFSVAILPILLTPPLMDVRWWFIKFPADMNYSVTNIYRTWEMGLLPGRFVPISDVSGLIYVYVGHKFLQLTQVPVDYFDLMTKVALIAGVYYTLKLLVRELNLGRNSEFVNRYPLILMTIWGLGANVFWKLNGTVAYPSLIYPTIIVATIFATAVLRNVRTISQNGFRLNTGTWLLALASTIWANFYYELAYTAVVAILIAVLISPTEAFSKKMRIRYSSVFLISFIAIWIPMRVILAKQCAANLAACYEGSQISPAGAPATFVKNIVNGLPLTDYSAIAKIQNGGLPFEISGLTLFVSIFISIVLILNLKEVFRGSDVNTHDLSENLIIQTRLAAILISTGVVAAAIMSVSTLSQQTVKWGFAYRHAPSLWLGYATLILLLITLLVSRTNYLFGATALVILVVVLTTGQWGRSYSAIRAYSVDFEPVSRLYHELYNADVSDKGLGNSRRCLIVDQLNAKDINVVRYLDPADKFMNTFHQIPFCNR